MTERVKARSSTFLACYIAIATAFVLVDGSGWWLKKKEKKHRKEQECEERWGGGETLASSSRLAQLVQSRSLPT